MSTIEEVIQAIDPLDHASMDAAASRQQQLTKPPGSLGRLEALSIQLAGIQRTARPTTDRKRLILAAADHGVAASGVSSYPQDVTAQMLRNFLTGGAAVNVLARHAGVDLTIVDAGIAKPLDPSPQLNTLRFGPGTQNIATGPAMSRETAEATVRAGIALAQDAAADTDLLAVGEMGIANTTAAAAVVSCLSGRPPAETTGRGASRTDQQLSAKIAVVQQAIALNNPDQSDGLDVLRCVGGFEIGVLAGVMLGAAATRTPIILDGAITAASALIAQSIAPLSVDYMIAGHRSVERGHAVALRQLGLTPLLDLDLRLGEGSGAILALGLVDAAAACLSEMATFSEAGVADQTATP